MSEEASEAKSEVKKGKSSGVPTWLQIVGAVVATIGTVGTVYSTIWASREKNRADLLAQQIANEKEMPHLDQGRFVFAGDVLKAVLSGKKDVAIEGLPNPEFAGTDLGKQINEEIKGVAGLKQLQSISVEFISFMNRGPRVVQSLKVTAPGEEDIDLGSVAVNTTKLLPVTYERRQPYKHLPAVDPKSPRTSFSISYTLAGEHHVVETSIAPRATIGWIPVVGNAQGVGRALSDEDMERHLELPQKP